MGYVDYFLIVWDFIKYAKDHGIAVGPGRGSAAGSIVSYCLGITTIDPIRYQLLFERFLNPERVSMPDIDVDFCYERRQEVIDYVVRKYGKDRVVQIVTFGTLAARGVIRDVGRVMDMPYAFVDSIAKMIPQEPKMTIEKALKVNPELRKMCEDDEEVKYLIEMAKRLEGLPRHSSMHAAGVVISQKSVDEYVPLSRAADGSVTTQFTMTTLEQLGLLKMDFLGLKNLTILSYILNNIEKYEGIRLNLNEIPLDDLKTFQMLEKGDTLGVFQLESPGMKNLFRQLKPRCLQDIGDANALYRPGPMGEIPHYIARRFKKEEVAYPHEDLKEILEPTYGIMIYQEQLMQVVQKIAGFSLSKADNLRRAISKKDFDLMASIKNDFIEGALKNGYSQKQVNEIFALIEKFADYGFNKSHAIAYGLIAYQLAYLKANHPLAFYGAILSNKIVMFIKWNILLKQRNIVSVFYHLLLIIQQTVLNK